MATKFTANNGIVGFCSISNGYGEFGIIRKTEIGGLRK